MSAAQVAPYFANDGFTIQVFLDLAGIGRGPLARLIQLTVLGAALAWCWRQRAADDTALFDFLCFVSVFWTYHMAYDFVVLLPPLLRALGEGLARQDRGRFAAGGGAFALLSLSFASFLYFGTALDRALRPLRWAARLLLVAWPIHLAIGMRPAQRPGGGG